MRRSDVNVPASNAALRSSMVAEESVRVWAATDWNGGNALASTSTTSCALSLGLRIRGQRINGQRMRVKKSAVVIGDPQRAPVSSSLSLRSLARASASYACSFARDTRSPLK